MRTPSYAAARWQALGSYASLVVADDERLTPARAACEQILEQVDRTCSRFREDSDLTRANRAAGHWVRVDPLLIRAVKVAVRVARDTDGLVDPTLGSQLVALGYDRDLAEIHQLTQDDARPAPMIESVVSTGSVPTGIPAAPEGWRLIGIDPEGALRVPEGVILDLGATGKAFAADLIAAKVPDIAGTSLIISLGGDVAVGTAADEARQANRPAGFRHPWRVSVAERPADADSEEAELIVLEEGGLATSSTLARRWRSGGLWMHHLLDPRTGRPVDPLWRTVSVCAASCLEANAASTAAIVMAEKAPAWLMERDLAARLVAADGSVVRVAGWPDPEQ